MANKFYWLRLKRDFFKRHDIRIIESMPNGKDYVLFYLKLLCESIDHEGRLRFSDMIPYNEEMLAVITNTNVDVVRSATKVFLQLGMMERMDDGTFFMNEVDRLTGSATDNPNANRQRAFRERKKSVAIEDKSSKADEPKPDYESEFSELWSLYPRKQGKQGAFKAFCKARDKGVGVDEIGRGIEAYKQYISTNRIEEQFVKQGSTWFNGGCWNDDYTTTFRTGNDRQGMTRDEDLDAMMIQRLQQRA